MGVEVCRQVRLRLGCKTETWSIGGACGSSSECPVTVLKDVCKLGRPRCLDVGNKLFSLGGILIFRDSNSIIKLLSDMLCTPTRGLFDSVHPPYKDVKTR